MRKIGFVLLHAQIYTTQYEFSRPNERILLLSRCEWNRHGIVIVETNRFLCTPQIMGACERKEITWLVQICEVEDTCLVQLDHNPS